MAAALEGLALAEDHEEPEWSALESEGRRLWMSIREQLGDRFEVGYALTVEGVDRVQVQWSRTPSPSLPVGSAGEASPGGSATEGDVSVLADLHDIGGDDALGAPAVEHSSDPSSLAAAPVSALPGTSDRASS
jgi:hypothetical protein